MYSPFDAGEVLVIAFAIRRDLLSINQLFSILGVILDRTEAR